MAPHRHCWWNWPSQVASVENLRHPDLHWLLPGHGHRRAFAAGGWRQQMKRTLAFCRSDS